MKLLGVIVSRALDAADAFVEAVNGLARVVLRGAFAPDARACRGPRFAQLAPADVLTQEIELNAGDRGEALKAVMLDAERLLPLAPEALAVDIAGPVRKDDRLRPRTERLFLLGAARKDALARAREALPRGRRGAVEAFVHAPPEHPALALVFVDDVGRQRRRRRHAALLAALALFAFAASDAARAGMGALARASAAAEAERVAVERRIRLAERRLAEAEAAKAALRDAPALDLAAVSARLNRIALHQPADAEALAVSLEGKALALNGRAYAPDAAELALRRAFEGETVSFSAESGEGAQAYSAQITVAAEASR